MMNSRQRLWLLVAFVVSVFSTILLLSYIVTDPGHLLIVLGGDGGHTYHAYLYHIMYEKGAWSQCINYPYGENIIYIDGLPILSISLSYLKALHFKPEQLLAIMHLAIGLSYLLAMLYTYKTLILFKVKPALAIIFSSLIIILSPQVFTLLGHFGLSNACVIPMLFYWSLRYYNSSHWRYPFYIVVFGCFMSFVHLYFGGIIFIWIIFYVLELFIFTKWSFTEKLKHGSIILLAGLGMMGVVKTIISLTDPIKDRPGFSSGFLNHVTTWKHIVASPHSPFWDLIKTDTWWQETSKSSEGYVYLSLAVIIVVIISLVRGIILLRKDRERLTVSSTGFQPIWLFIAIGALLLGMGIPFIWNMTWLFNYLSLFRQFRSMGRFSWIFYYIITVYAAIVVNNWYIKTISAKKYFLAYGSQCH